MYIRETLLHLHLIEGNDIGTAWIKSIKLVLQHGTSVPDDKGSIREVSPLYIHIHHPIEPDPVIEQYGDKDILTFMKRNFEEQQPVPGWGYSYAQRLYGNEDAVATVIERLQQYPTTKSATVSLLQPANDQQHTPCLATLDFKFRQQTLCVHAFFRSQDIGKKFYADALQLLRLGQHIASVLLVDSVSLFLTVCSAHVYEVDIPKMEQLVHKLL